MNHSCALRSLAAGMMLVATVLVSACGSIAVGAPAENAAAATPLPLTVEALKNAEYNGIYPEPVRLTDGQYEGPPFVEGGASRPTVTFIEPYALGDLDGDGVSDAAVLLVESSGGSGSFVYLAAVLNRAGSPESAATTLLSDRDRVDSLSIADGQIAVKMLSHGPDDPMCCPTVEESRTYVLQDGQLIQAGQISPTAQP